MYFARKICSRPPFLLVFLRQEILCIHISPILEIMPAASPARRVRASRVPCLGPGRAGRRRHLSRSDLDLQGLYVYYNTVQLSRAPGAY